MGLRGLGRLIAIAVLGGVPLGARADVYTPYSGARSLGMGGAQRALGGSNDSLLLNPATMAATRRYGAHLSYAGGGDHIHRLLASTVDSQTGNLAAGVSYMRTWGNPSGSHPRLSETHVALAYSPFPLLSLGLSAQNVSGSFTERGQRRRVNLFNSSLGALLHLTDIIGVGISWENYVAARATPLLSRALGLGVGVGFHWLRAAADLRLFPGQSQPHRRELSTGAEVVVAKLFVLRGGYRLAMKPIAPSSPRMHWASGGLGVAFGQLGIDASFQIPIHSREWHIGTGFSWLM